MSKTCCTGRLSLAPQFATNCKLAVRAFVSRRSSTRSVTSGRLQKDRSIHGTAANIVHSAIEVAIGKTQNPFFGDPLLSRKHYSRTDGGWDVCVVCQDEPRHCPKAL